MKLGIVSYCDHLRTYAHFNHQVYADLHNYMYIFDIAPTKHARYFSKIDKITKFLDLFDWVFWIDDDAFFTNFSYGLMDVIERYPDSDFIFCKSPVNQGSWTHISSGNFFIKNTDAARKLLLELHNVDLGEVKRWWDSSKYGVFTNGDQDALVYLLNARGKKRPSCTILDYEHFNTRPFHYKKRLDEHFLVHFTGGDKRGQAQAFAKRFGVLEDIVPESTRKLFFKEKRS